MIAYELELLDHAERLQSDESITRQCLIEPRANNEKTKKAKTLSALTGIISQYYYITFGGSYVDSLTNIEYRYLDSVLMKYRHLPSRIARRRLEIETEHSTDINVGASKTNQVTKRTEWLVERFDSDVKLKGLECQQRAVEATIELLDDTMKRVFELRWIDERTPEEIAELTNSTVKNTQKKLERIMEIFADYWGWT